MFKSSINSLRLQVLNSRFRLNGGYIKRHIINNQEKLG